MTISITATDSHIDAIEAAMDRQHRARRRGERPVKVMRKAKSLSSHRR